MKRSFITKLLVYLTFILAFGCSQDYSIYEDAVEITLKFKAYLTEQPKDSFDNAKLLLICYNNGNAFQRIYDVEMQPCEDENCLYFKIRIEAADIVDNEYYAKFICSNGTVLPFKLNMGEANKNEDGVIKCILDTIESSNLPVLSVVTPNFKAIEDKEVWIDNVSVILYSHVSHQTPLLEAEGKVKGRGNQTWKAYPKKPYALKFTDKQSPFGFPSNKSWVLLADFLDKSFMRTAYMSEASRAAEIDFTYNYCHLNLYINGEYNGIYVLTDKIEKKKNRIEIKDDGFLVEDDHYYYEEPLYFETELFHDKYTFKYPDPDDNEIVMGDSNFVFIQTYINNVERTLSYLENNPNNEEYLEYLDLDAFAKYYLASEAIGSRDPNRFYVLPSKDSKLKMMPLWDAEYTMGFDFKPEFKAENLARIEIWGNAYSFFYRFLRYSPLFWKDVAQKWPTFYENMNARKAIIDSVANRLSVAKEYDYKRWPASESYLERYTPGYINMEEDIQFLKDFLDIRLQWMDDYIKKHVNN